MGIAGAVFGKLALPIGLIAVIGAGLFVFRDQILGSIRGGASVLGEAITTPIGSFFQGVSQGFAGIPESIDFRLPSFNFVFGQSDPSNDPIGQLQTDFDNFIKNSQAFFDNLFKSGGQGTTPTPMPLPTNPLTLLGGSVPVSLPGGIERLSREEVAGTGGAGAQVLALFDIVGTPETEFLPFTQAGVLSAQEFGFDIKFSAQLFEEIKNIQDVINFSGGN